MSFEDPPFQPTFRGYVSTTMDALILFEACLQGHLSHISRRPHDQERSSVITSGSVFIYEENTSGIQRWTDGMSWTHSSIVGSFLMYQEMDRPFSPDKKKRTMHKQISQGDHSRRPCALGAGNESSGTQTQPSKVEGHLPCRYISCGDIKSDGLIKKAMSITVRGIVHHLVSYHTAHDVAAKRLQSPSQTQELECLQLHPELTSKLNLRPFIGEMGEFDGIKDGTG